jgi:hypothetical protein
VLGAAGVLLLLSIVVLWPLARRDPGLRFWCVGALLALLPACATFPHDRLLLMPGVGAMAVVATLLALAWERRRRVGAAVAGAGLALVHLVAAPILLPLRASRVGDFDKLLRASDGTLPSEPTVRQQTLVLLNPALDPLAAYLPAYREVVGRPRPEHQLWLGTATRDIQLRTLDSHRLELRPRGGFVLTASESMLRRPGSGPAQGERISLAAAQVVVHELTDDGRPLRVVVEFEKPLSDPNLRFLRWQGTGYVEIDLPSVGETLLLPRADLFGLLLGRGAPDA